MTVNSKALQQTGQKAIRTFANAAAMIKTFEQSFQFEDQVFYLLEENKFYKYLGTANGAITDYTEVTLKGDSSITSIPKWNPENSYDENDIINHEGNLYKATEAITGNPGNASPNITGAPWDKVIKTIDEQLDPKLPEWDKDFDYIENDIVAYNGFIWVSQTNANKGNAPSFTQDENWKEYRRHVFERAEVLEVARSLGYFLENELATPRVITQADLDDMGNGSYLRYHSGWKIFYWSKVETQ
ncbi:MAG: hypothetical protein N0C84_01140 [Candidatus Thiodiazotropha taylori]|uniref:Chitin-binding type-3 domain-containing protein n=1 Tax=Candidatus Thiodiazotropha taylori TaxID=2792791 RepID=A0A9E4N245_9GAMM|nr:hypothetical protein [Candidatus Thiodiazotropha taylori]MCW4255051.1 hypothetical protein [Candidatus Thiodiazotropha taylori]